MIFQDFLFVKKDYRPKLNYEDKSLVIDWTRIEALMDPDDPSDIEWMKEMMVTLYENMEVRVRNVNSFVSNREFENLRSELHQIKGVAANFGLTKLFDTVQKAEAMIKEGQSEESLPLAQTTESIWVETKLELQTKYP